MTDKNPIVKVRPEEFCGSVEHNPIPEGERWISPAMVEQARYNIALDRAIRVQILNDNNLEKQAYATPYLGSSVKAIVDEWIVEKGIREYGREGRGFYIYLKNPFDGATHLIIAWKRNIIVEYFEMAYRRYQESLLEDSLTS